MLSRLESSPLETYRVHLASGKLAYQFDVASNKPVFHPRVVAPVTGNDSLEWRISQGLGTVYATTILYPRGEPAYNVVLIDMDEGFRLMSRVESVPAADVRIGMRVRVRVHQPEGDAPSYPVFDPVEAA